MYLLCKALSTNRNKRYINVLYYYTWCPISWSCPLTFVTFCVLGHQEQHQISTPSLRYCIITLHVYKAVITLQSPEGLAQVSILAP